MTTLTKDEIIALSEESGMTVTDYGSGPFVDDGVTTQMLEKFAHLCRADLVEKVSDLRAAATLFQEERDALRAEVERLKAAP